MTDPGSGADRVGHHLAGLGIAARPYRLALLHLAGGTTFPELVRATGLPRRELHALLEAVGEDVEDADGVLRLTPSAAVGYASRFRLASLADTALEQPGDRRLRAAPDLVARMTELVSAAPASVRSLDHVPATSETAIRRALWMDSTYDLAGATLLCVGDHDLTSLAVCLVNPAVRVVVADVDEGLLEFVSEQAATLGARVEARWADFRLGLPASARAAADLVFTDPPYTPEGVRLFLLRGLEGLRDRAQGRLLMAYGFGSHQPSLGLKVQQSVLGLGLALEAILPDFSRYDGAQAVGSTSDLYVCRPTPGSWAAVERAGSEVARIYTQGSQSVERDVRLPPDVVAALLAAAPGEGSLSVRALVALERPRVEPPLVGLALEDVVDGSAQASIAAPRTSAVAVDLTGDPGSWLLRTLLGLRAARVAIAVDNNHPRLRDERSQQLLRQLVKAKWSLRFRRSWPDSRHAIVEAVATRAGGSDPVLAAQRVVLDGANRRLGNAWRDALVKAGRSGGAGVSKAEAQRRIDEADVPERLLGCTLAELPEHEVRWVLETVARQAVGRDHEN